jgi:hypothetical protein
MKTNKNNGIESKSFENHENETIEQFEKAQNEQPEKELTPEQQKAARILRAKLPALSERNFNFEKRTGSVFTASLIKVWNEDGSAKMDNGKQVEKLVRKVVTVENENGEFLPEFADVETEIKQKRCAALVLHAEDKRGKLEAEKLEIEKRLADIIIDLLEFDNNVELAKQVVMDVVLPERSEAERVTLKVKLETVNSKLDKMRAMLLSMGLSEDEIEQQLNG